MQQPPRLMSVLISYRPMTMDITALSLVPIRNGTGDLSTKTAETGLLRTQRQEGFDVPKFVRDIAWWIFWKVKLPGWLAPYWFAFAIGASLRETYRQDMEQRRAKR